MGVHDCSPHTVHTALDTVHRFSISPFYTDYSMYVFNIYNDVMNRICLLILLPLFLSFSLQAEELPDEASDKKFSTWLWEYLTVGASITAGVGARSVVVDVTRQGTNDNGKILGKKENALFLFYSTKENYFGRSNVGYAWMLNLSTIRINEQELGDGSVVDLGTEVNGYFATAVPTIFYNVGDKHRGHYIRAGIGLGVGAAEFDGDVVLTESPTNERATISNGTSNFFLALGAFIDYQWENFTIQLSTSGPNIEYNGYEINVSGSSLMFGYTYYL